MQRYLLRRLAYAVPTLFGLTILVFFLLHAVLKTNTVDLIMAQYGANDPKLAADLRHQLGLTGSIVTQYFKWLGDVVTGNLGSSYYSHRTVINELSYRLPVTIELGFGSLILTLLIAVPIGVLSAVKQDSLPDYAFRGSAILFYAIPGFWLATLVLIFGSIWFGWAPRLDYKAPWVNLGANLEQLLPPMILLALAPLGALVRLVRTQVLESVRQDYVRTARAKGLPTRTVYFSHVLRNSMLPIVTLVGLQLPRVLAGTVIFEQIFSLPGVGQYLVDSVAHLDYPVLLALNLIFGTIMILSNLLVDMSYAWIDPRVRYA